MLSAPAGPIGQIDLATEPTGPDEGPGDVATGRRAPSLATVVGLAFGVWGLLIGLGSLHDNSFLTHLATGRLIFDRGSVPTVDPYSFTANGRGWVVQSWLASTLYAGAEKVGGLGLLRVLLGLCTGALSLLVWRLTRSASGLVPRVVVAGLAVAGGVGFWVERPLTFGLIGLALVLLAAEDGLDPRWLVPVMWVWANTHGSFPIGVGLLVLLTAGRMLDRRTFGAASGAAGDDARRRPPEQRALGWALVGTALAAVNPLGPALLTFPLRLLAHSENFRAVVEWQPPAFDQPSQIMFLVELVATVAVVGLRRRRWSSALVIVAFTAMALTSARNVAPASIVLVPFLADGLRGLGTLDGSRRSPATRVAAVAVVVLAVVLGLSTVRTQPDTQLNAYPTEAIAWMHDRGLVATSDAQVVAPDFVGNFLEAKYGASARAFVDDRVDMYPTRIVQGAVTLKHVGPGWQDFLRSLHPTAVVWKVDDPLGRQLSASADWKLVHRDRTWGVFVPR